MFQIIAALIIIIFFLSKTYWQRKNNKISKSEFIFWFIFWIAAGLFIVLLKKIDYLVASLGFTASGIDVLAYFSIAVIFYFIFKIVIKIEKIEKNITKIIRDDAIKSSSIDTSNFENKNK